MCVCKRARACVCRLSYPACNAHAPCCHLWLECRYKIFPHYLINGKIFGGGLKTKGVFWFSLQLLSETFLIPRKTNEIIPKMYNGLNVKYPPILSDFNETWILWINVRKILKTSDFMKIRPVGAEMLHAAGQMGRQTHGQTDRHDEA